MKKGVMLISCLMFTMGFASAATYYVSPAGTASWPACTNINTPCSLSAVGANARAGDMVYFRAGTYSGLIQPTHGGSSGNEITFAAYNGEHVIFTRTGGLSFSLIGLDYFIIDGIQFGTDSGAGSYGHIRMYNSDHNEIKNCIFYHNNYPDMSLGGYDSSTGIWGSSDYDYVHDNIFYPYYEAVDENTEADTMGLANAHYDRIINNEFHEGAGHSFIQVGYYSNYNVIRGNSGYVTTYWNSASNPDKAGLDGFIMIERFANHNLFEENTFKVTGTVLARSGFFQLNSDKYTIFRRNKAINPRGYISFYSNWASSGADDEYNCLYNNLLYNIGNMYSERPGVVNLDSSRSYPGKYNYDRYNSFVNNVFDTSQYNGFKLYDDPTYTYGNSFRGNVLYNIGNCDGCTPDMGSTFGPYYPPWYEVYRYDTGMTLAEAEATYPDEFSGNSISQPTYKDAANVDFTPASSSSAQVDAGAWLTTITSATGSGTTFNVDNPYFFYDGWNITGETGDTIETQGGQKAVITRIAYSTGKITVDKTISWTQGEGLSLPYSGSAPDIGAIEYTGAQGCSEDWQCTVWSLWSACADNEQSRTRTCTDANSCGTTTGKPAESETQSCSASTNTYTILKTSTPPTIDGKINEFANANQITSTNSRGTTGTYKMLWDSNGLYIAAQVSDHQLAALNSTRDGALWGDDSIELFFDPLNNGGTYLSSDDYKFFVNLLNTQRDNYIGGGGISWNAAFSSAVKTTGTLNTPGNADTGYTIEIAIPWTNWGVAVPADNSVWGFDVSMDDRDDSGDVIQKSWSQTNVGNIPDEFGDVTFSSQIVTPSQSVCNTPADSDSNGMISITELISYISMWKSGNVSIGDLIAAIGKWKNGC